jgi:hypothetical protein
MVDEVGVSILDTRDVFKLPSLSSDFSDIISSESRRINHQIPLCRPTFLFGTSDVIARDDLEQYLNSKILIKDENSGNRNIVIVGQEIRAERLAMKHIGVDLYDFDKYPSVVGILDTRMLSYLVLEKSPEFTYNTSLDGLLESFGIPYQKEYLHVAGNDANFTLKALLMIVARSVEGLDLDADQRYTVAKLQAIAQASIEDKLSTPTVSYQIWSPHEFEHSYPISFWLTLCIARHVTAYCSTRRKGQTHERGWLS